MTLILNKNEYVSNIYLIYYGGYQQGEVKVVQKRIWGMICWDKFAVLETKLANNQ